MLYPRKKLNEVFFHFIRTKRPFIVMKYAMTMDGKIAAYTGASKWITGEEARKHVHEQRNKYSAVMAGLGTVLADDPLLTCRAEGGRNPVRIICDTHLRMPPDSQIVKTAEAVPTILATCSTDKQKHGVYEGRGCRVLTVSEQDGHVNLSELMNLLGQENIDSILLEGGGMLNWSALQSGIVQKVQAYIAPKLFGGEEAKTPIGGIGFPSPGDALHLKNSIITKLGEDFLIESEVAEHVHRDC